MRFLAVCSFLLIVAGCGAREEIVVSRLDLGHRGWDTLHVSVRFAARTVLGGMHPAAENERYIVAFNASYDTLYAGADTVFSIPDADLGNQEKVLVEVCGEVKLLRVCEQATTQASPKRVTIQPDITYPLRKKVFEGEYALPFVVERMDGDAWKSVNPSASLQGYMKAYVQGREEASMRIPFSRPKGGFNLAQQSNYKDFKYYLDSALLDEKATSVIFDVYVDMEGISDAVGSVAREIKVKTEEEHKQDLTVLVERAADLIVDHLSPFLRGRRNTVYIDKWNYNTFKRMYSVEMEIAWDGSLFNLSSYRLSGVLEMYEDGGRASFRYVDGNRRARQQWEARVKGQVLDLFPQNDSETWAPRYENGPFREADGRVVIEAEHFESSRIYNDQSWTVSRDHGGFLGEGAVVVAPDRGVRIRSRYNKRSPELTYSIQFTERGTYYVWLRVWASDDNSNSVHVGVDGAANRSSSYIGTESYGRWVWTRKRLDSDDDATVSISSPGVKKLNIWMREDGFYIDKILLTKDRRFIPESSGPVESPR